MDIRCLSAARQETPEQHPDTELNTDMHYEAPSLLPVSPPIPIAIGIVRLHQSLILDLSTPTTTLCSMIE